MSNNKQTAVEWLVEKLKSQGLLIGEPKNLVAVKQAKEMEKQQIIETARFYFHERGKATPEQYYIKEYGDKA